ncbi:MAG: Fic family protein [Prevotella sp.]|jgi:death-on-curing protein|nr:Fic family protein [Prevotella sp.]
MEHIERVLLSDYSQMKRRHCVSEDSDLETISEDDVLRSHYLMADYFYEEDDKFLLFGIKDYGLLSSAVNRQNAGFGGIQKWSSKYQKMATLFYGIIMNHAFHDGNKRTALLSLLFHLHKNGLTPICRKDAFEDIALKIVTKSLSDYAKFEKYKDSEGPEINFVADFIEENTREYSEKHYSLTFEEFNRNLQKHSVKLKVKGNRNVDVMICNKEFNGQVSEEVVFTTPFHGWKKQISKKVSEEILQKAKLTSEYGIDSEVFYSGANPIYLLIENYNEPLRRLKNK